MRRRVWVNLPALLKEGDIEREIERISSIGFEELLLLISDGNITLFDSNVRPGKPDYKFHSSLEKTIEIAHKVGLRVHAWIVTLKISNEIFVKEHADWYVVNRIGESSTVKPPYVEDYKWLCPRKPQVIRFIKDFFVEVASRFNFDGLHFDYIRLPDIILPKGLRSRYPGVPLEEVYTPRFDFCYCGDCRMLFMSEVGVDPIRIGYDDPLYQRFFRWRADGVTHLVKEVYSTVKNVSSNIEVSAAVFPTPTIAYKYVFQRWHEWPLDLYDPMIYHKYYEKDVEWIGEAVREAASLNLPISAGILLDFMEKPEEIHRALQLAINNGAKGITIFVYPPKNLKALEWVKNSLNTLRHH